MFGTMENDRKMRRQGSNLSLTRVGQSEFSLFSKKKRVIISAWMGGWVGILQLLFGSEGVVVDFSTFILFLYRLFGFTSFFRCKNGHIFFNFVHFFHILGWFRCFPCQYPVKLKRKISNIIFKANRFFFC